MPEKQCPECNEEIESVDLDECADFYYCECGYEQCDPNGWAERMQEEAEFYNDLRRG